MQKKTKLISDSTLKKIINNKLLKHLQKQNILTEEMNTNLIDDTDIHIKKDYNQQDFLTTDKTYTETDYKNFLTIAEENYLKCYIFANFLPNLNEKNTVDNAFGNNLNETYVQKIISKLSLDIFGMLIEF